MMIKISKILNILIIITIIFGSIMLILNNEINIRTYIFDYKIKFYMCLLHILNIWYLSFELNELYKIIKKK